MNTQIEETVERIQQLLDGDSISDKARDYIEKLVKGYGIEECARLDHNDRIGLSVFENKNGERSLHYGPYSYGCSDFIDAVYCNIEDILDAAERNDEIPYWWQDEGTVIFVDCKNGCGERLSTKGAVEYEQEN